MIRWVGESNPYHHILWLLSAVSGASTSGWCLGKTLSNNWDLLMIWPFRTSTYQDSIKHCSCRFKWLVFSKQVSNFQIKTCVIPVYGFKSLNLAMAHLLLSPLSAERSPTSQPNVREISVPPTVGQYLFAARLLGHGKRKCDMERIAEFFLEALKWRIHVCYCALIKTNTLTDSETKRIS